MAKGQIEKDYPWFCPGIMADPMKFLARSRDITLTRHERAIQTEMVKAFRKAYRDDPMLRPFLASCRPNLARDVICAWLDDSFADAFEKVTGDHACDYGIY